METCDEKVAGSVCGLAPNHPGLCQPTTRCPAHARLGGSNDHLVQCEIRVVEGAVHAGDHSQSGVRWTERAAIYPGTEAFRREVDLDVGRALESLANPDRTQVGGTHYSDMRIQPWAVIESLGLDFFQGNALKYLMRAGRKGPALEDLKKAKHYIEKCIEREERRG